MLRSSPQTLNSTAASVADRKRSTMTTDAVTAGHCHVTTFVIARTGLRRPCLAASTWSWIWRICDSILAGMAQVGIEGNFVRKVTCFRGTEASLPSSYFTTTSVAEWPWLLCTTARYSPSTSTRAPDSRSPLPTVVHSAFWRAARSCAKETLGRPSLKQRAAQDVRCCSSVTLPWRSCSTMRFKKRVMAMVLRQRATLSKPSSVKGAFKPPMVISLRRSSFPKSKRIPARTKGTDTQVNHV
mmetsp:Transcript_131935/g.282159  ORF Transcript_131935/g.282159 Transcript_131935/m.282159 type:complete len:241 (+) Transcript_131935:267-989(+)